MDKFLDVAKEAARQAGELLLANLGKPREVGYKGEGHFNPASLADREAEGIILDVIGRSFPGHNIISEEKGDQRVAADYAWIIDPLDGTVNYLHGQRHFGVSIALRHRAETVLGLVYNPVLGEMFTAVRGGGAYLNEERMRVSTVSRLGESLVSVSFPYDRHSAAFAASLKSFNRLVYECQAIRREGSTALSLCHVACGRLDGFCVAGNELWDFAAGLLLVTEAGGEVTDFQGEAHSSFDHTSEVLATNGLIHAEVVRCLKEEA